MTSVESLFVLTTGESLMVSESSSSSFRTESADESVSETMELRRFEL